MNALLLLFAVVGLSLPIGAGQTVDYQLGGAYAPAADVGIVTRDRSDAPADGVYSICYVNAFQTQPDERAWWDSEHPDLLLRDDGEPVIDAGWPDEVILDIGTDDKREQLADIVGEWFSTCADDGFAAIEPDNLDAWTRSRGLLTADDAAAFASLLVERAHDAGLAIGQKNAAEMTGDDLGFDFAVAEECEVYEECGTYVDAFGSRVIEIEYTDNGVEAFERACAVRGGEVGLLLRDRDVVPRGEPGYVSRSC